MPFHLAFNITPEQADRFKLSPSIRVVMSMMFAEFEGQQFDYGTLKPIKRK